MSNDLSSSISSFPMLRFKQFECAQECGYSKLKIKIKETVTVKDNMLGYEQSCFSKVFRNICVKAHNKINENYFYPWGLNREGGAIRNWWLIQSFTVFVFVINETKSGRFLLTKQKKRWKMADTEGKDNK